MVNESISGGYYGSSDSLDLIQDNHSDTDLWKIELVCFTSTSQSNTKENISSPTQSIKEQKPYEFAGILELNLTNNYVSKIYFFNNFFDGDFLNKIVE